MALDQKHSVKPEPTDEQLKDRPPAPQGSGGKLEAEEQSRKLKTLNCPACGAQARNILSDIDCYDCGARYDKHGTLLNESKLCLQNQRAALQQRVAELEAELMTAQVSDNRGNLVRDPERALARRFFQLGYVQKVKLAAELSLLDEADDDLTDQERQRRYLVRAKEKGLLQKLWDRVEQLHNVTTATRPSKGEE